MKYSNLVDLEDREVAKYATGLEIFKDKIAVCRHFKKEQIFSSIHLVIQVFLQMKINDWTFFVSVEKCWLPKSIYLNCYLKIHTSRRPGVVRRTLILWSENLDRYNVYTLLGVLP